MIMIATTTMLRGWDMCATDFDNKTIKGLTAPGETGR